MIEPNEDIRKYEEIYHTHGVYRIYVDRYARQNHMTVEDALRVEKVRFIGDRYKEAEVRNL